MQAIGVTRSALVVTRGQAPEIAKALRNLPRIKAVRADLLNVLDLLRYDMVVMTSEAVDQANELWSETARAPRKVRPYTPKPPREPRPLGKKAARAKAASVPETDVEPEAAGEPEAVEATAEETA